MLPGQIFWHHQFSLTGVLTMLSLLNPKAETIRRGQALQVCAFEEDAF